MDHELIYNFVNYVKKYHHLVDIDRYSYETIVDSVSNHSLILRYDDLAPSGNAANHNELIKLQNLETKEEVVIKLNTVFCAFTDEQKKQAAEIFKVKIDFSYIHFTTGINNLEVKYFHNKLIKSENYQKDIKLLNQIITNITPQLAISEKKETIAPYQMVNYFKKAFLEKNNDFRFMYYTSERLSFETIEELRIKITLLPLNIAWNDDGIIKIINKSFVFKSSGHFVVVVDVDIKKISPLEYKTVLSDIYIIPSKIFNKELKIRGDKKLPREICLDLSDVAEYKNNWTVIEEWVRDKEEEDDGSWWM